MPIGWRGMAPVALAIVALLGAALAGDLSPAPMLRWYAGLRRPEWQPPDWVLPLAWGAIYALIALSTRRAWRAAPDRRAREVLVAALALNLFLNLLWAVLFFVHRRPDWAMAEQPALILSTLLLMAVAGGHDGRAGWLLMPYLAWLGFAAVLNLAILRLNGFLG